MASVKFSNVITGGKGGGGGGGVRIEANLLSNRTCTPYYLEGIHMQ